MNLFHTVQADFIAQTGDPTGTGRGGESVFCQLYGPQARFFEAECMPRIKHTKPGLISMVNCGESVLGSQFFLTLGEELDYLDGEHCVFGEVVEGDEVLSSINNTITDNTGRPYQDIRITHTVVLHDPYDDPPGLVKRESSPEPSAEMLASSRIGADENINDYAGKSEEEINEIIAEKEAKARATILEMVGDIPDAEIAPPENVLFVCKLNPVTCDDDLEIIFSRFGPVVSCEVIKDRVSGDSLQYAFVEFADRGACEQAYFKMDNVLIDDRRIHVDFSQSVSKFKWTGKGRLEIIDDKKQEEKKKVDLKELINKERAEIKVNKDGKIERNRENLTGRDREDANRGRDDKNGRGGGLAKKNFDKDDWFSHNRDKPKEKKEQIRVHRDDEPKVERRDEKNFDKDDWFSHNRDKPKEKKEQIRVHRDDEPKGERRDDRSREDKPRDKRDDRPRDRRDERKYRKDDRREGGDRMRGRDEREDNRRDRDRRSKPESREHRRDDRRGEERDRPRAKVDQFGRERPVERRRGASSGSDSSQERRRKR